MYTEAPPSRIFERREPFSLHSYTYRPSIRGGASHILRFALCPVLDTAHTPSLPAHHKSIVGSVVEAAETRYTERQMHHTGQRKAIRQHVHSNLLTYLAKRFSHLNFLLYSFYQNLSNHSFQNPPVCVLSCVYISHRLSIYCEYNPISGNILWFLKKAKCRTVEGSWSLKSDIFPFVMYHSYCNHRW